LTLKDITNSKKYYIRMAKLYSKKIIERKLNPKKETVSFLLNYSKSLWVVKTRFHQIVELHLN